MDKWKKVGLVLTVLVIAMSGAIIFWASGAAAPMQEAVNMLTSNETVEVDTLRWLVFRPVGSDVKIGLVFYPGGNVDPTAYAPAAVSIAEAGTLVVVVPMPLNMAFLAPDRVEEVVAAFPQVKNWYIGGHSLGGAIAAQYVFQHPGEMQGLVMWAAYPAQSNDLSDQDIMTLSISGSLDGLVTQEKIEATRNLLPDRTVFLCIEGGNHAQFGWYGDQRGDLPAVISRQEQQRQIIAATIRFLRQH